MNVFSFVRSSFNTRRMSVYSRWWMEIDKMLFMFITIVLLQCVHSADDVPSRDPGKVPQTGRFRFAEIKITYTDPKTKKFTSKDFQGKFGLSSVHNKVEGTVMYAMSKNKNSIDHVGCKRYDNKVFPSVKWIALVERGQCNFSKKIHIATRVHNASAVVVYDSGSDKDAIMNHGEKNTISVFISHEEGMRIVNIMKQGTTVNMHVIPGEEVPFDHTTDNNISKTSVLFVSISFIVLMIISLAWLVFYYIQRFRYSHAKERLARRLACAAKKAIAKIPQSTVKSGDKVLEGDHDQCAVCIEHYKPHEVIRILPCTHIFHKSCVDPWLQENRSCPMCKMDILVAYGMQIGTSQESVHHNADPGPAAQLVIEDPEVSSSVEEARAEVVQLSSICLHYTREDDAEDAQPSSQLLGSQEEVHLSSLSLHSNNGSTGASLSRAEKRDIEESNDKEVKALIEKEFNSVKSDGDEDDDDDDDNNKNDGEISKEESVSMDNKDDDDDDIKDSCCSLSIPEDKDDDMVNKDSTVVALNTGNCDNVDVEFHQEWDVPPSSTSYA